LWQVLAQASSVRALFVEHLVLQWEYGVMSSEAVDRCLQRVQHEANVQRGWRPAQDEDAPMANDKA
jgi:hypothetical protein